MQCEHSRETRVKPHDRYLTGKKFAFVAVSDKYLKIVFTTVGYGGFAVKLMNKA